MTLALATSLVECGHVDAAHVSAKYAEFYESWRGYGGAAHRVMRLLQDGGDYRGTGRLQFPEGSFGNGGAMRIAPVGLPTAMQRTTFCWRPWRTPWFARTSIPRPWMGLWCRPRRWHWPPRPSRAAFDPNTFVCALSSVCRTDVMAAKLKALAEGLHHKDEDVYVIGRVGNGIRASEAVAAALWAFLRYWQTPEECIIRAVGFGGDTDTIGAMAGALVGALHGSSWIPARWYDNIENGVHGRDEIVALARRLAGLDIRSPK